MVSQVDRKLRTRKALMDGALELVGEGKHYAGVSLREVAKRAGVAPNAFYRHFNDLDELGLVLVDEFGLLLRQLMRQARMQGLAADRMISDSVDFYIEHVKQQPMLFRFMAQTLTGGSPAMRQAIRNELGYFAKEMVVDLERLGILTQISPSDMDMLGHLVINTVSSSTTEVLDLPEGSEKLVSTIRDRTVKQIRMIFLGASAWDTQSGKEKKQAEKNKRKSQKVAEKKASK